MKHHLFRVSRLKITQQNQTQVHAALHLRLIPRALAESIFVTDYFCGKSLLQGKYHVNEKLFVGAIGRPFEFQITMMR